MAASLWEEPDRKRWLNALWGGAFVLGAAARWGARHASARELGESMTGLIPPYYNYTAFVVAAAAAAAFAAAAAVARAPEQEGRGGYWRLLPLLAFFCWILYLQRARAASLGLAGGLRLGLGAPLRLARRLALAGAAAGLLGLTLFASLPEGRRDFLLKKDKSQVAKRPEIWAAALAVARDHPVLGDPGGFGGRFPQAQFPLALPRHELSIQHALRP